MHNDVLLLRRFASERRHVDIVYSAARRQVRDAARAQDVTQEVFIGSDREGIESQHIAQNPTEMLMQLGEITATPVVIESPISDSRPMTCGMHRSLEAHLKTGKLTGAELDELLANVSKQTSLLLKRQRRDVPIWTWSQSAASPQPQNISPAPR